MSGLPEWLDIDQINARARELTGIARRHGEDVAQAVASGMSLPDALATEGVYAPPSRRDQR